MIETAVDRRRNERGEQGCVKMGRVLGSGRFLTNFSLSLCRINGELLQGNLKLGKGDIHPAP